MEKPRLMGYTRDSWRITATFPPISGTASMSKALSILAMTIAAILLVIFGLDLATGFPFRGESLLMDIGFVTASAVLGYLSWNSLRDQM